MRSKHSLQVFREAALFQGSVGSLASNKDSLHAAYRYPARFSPVFAKAAIETFSSPEDLVLDPFSGGGTVALEASLSRRHVFSSDLSPLAAFLTKAKNEIYESDFVDTVQNWLNECLELRINQMRTDLAPAGSNHVDLGTLNSSQHHLIRTVLGSWEYRLRNIGKAENLARLCLLRCGQNALDMKRTVPNIKQLRELLFSSTDNTLSAARIHRQLLEDIWSSGSRVADVQQLAIEQISTVKELQKHPADLAVFSPPYPGVHVLYPRWQVLGRRETSAPFWLAGVKGETGETTYTMGRRGIDRTDEYMDQYENGLQSLRQVLKPGAFVVQMVGFLDPENQLPKFLSKLKEAGFEERKYATCSTGDDGRLWRSVPGQKWYNAVRDKKPKSSREVVLIHRYQ